METLEENFEIEVNRYMVVNFQAFANLVDAVGGVTLELSNEEVQYVNGYLVEYNQLQGRAEGTDYLDSGLSGAIHLNGPQALAYCRNRSIGSDFARTERQRKVISAAMKNAPIALATNGSELVNGLLSNITTNLTSKELSGLFMQAPLMLTYDMVSGSIPLAGTYSNANIRGMAVLEIDFEANKAYIQKEIYGK
jgi:LCP family protein required for cell wall assembly